MPIASTFSLPSASAAMAATSAESIPPLKPTDDLAEAALANIITGTEHESPIGSLGIVVVRLRHGQAR